MIALQFVLEIITKIEYQIIELINYNFGSITPKTEIVWKAIASKKTDKEVSLN